MPSLRLPEPPLRDDRVVLRPWTEADLPAAAEGARDPLVPRFTRVPENQSDAELRRFFGTHDAALAGGEALWLAISDAASDAFLGSSGLMRFDWEELRCEIGYWVAPWARGQGVATRATRLLSRWALLDLGLGRLSLHADTDNPASHRVAERAGFIREGVLRSYERRKGMRHDLVSYSLVASDLDTDSSARS
ncbi:MAG: GNAT family N-acetyltransferase [Thermoleophilaceae bacterium]|nr:GNAT family N-acetyltransferase [Thermoleophilaceae bacterium]